jgi:hypothetical protein
LRQQFDPLLVGAAEDAAGLPGVGITVCSTIPMYAADADCFGRYSTAYLAKPVCREMHAAAWLAGPDGSPLVTSLALVKSWENPYQSQQTTRMRPWAIFTGVGSDGLPPAPLDAMIRWLECPAFLRPIDLPLATSRRGETVEATCALVGRLPEGWRVRGRRAEVSLAAFTGGEPIGWLEADVAMRGTVATMKVSDTGDAFLLPVRFEIIDDQRRVRDYSQSAVVPWRPEKLRAGPILTVNGRYFDYCDGARTAKASFLVGANWQDRVQYAFTWHNPNGLRVAGDALKMAAAGMRIVRTHYMMPGWMRTFPGQIYAGTVPEVYDQFELGPELSERHLRAIEAHVMIFNSLGILFQPTVFTVPPPQMGSPNAWSDNARLAACPGLVENQQRFSRQLVERFGGVPGIVWDVVNEANTDMTRFGEWLCAMKPIWGKYHQLVGIGTSGILSNVQLGESADWHSLHSSPVFRHDNGFHTGKPHLLQEAWIDTAATRSGETDLGRLTGLGVAMTLHDHGAGYMPWNWNQFYANWRYGTKFVELWDNDLGACVHADATPRRGGVLLRNWAVLLDGVSFDQRANRQAVFVYPKTFYAGEGTTEYLHALYNNRVPFHALNDAEVAGADLAAAKLVILPYTARGYRESTWKRLRQFAANGGAVVAHNDSLLLDEDGRLAEGRRVPMRQGRERLGAGWFDWTMGWTVDSKDVIVGRLARTFDELKLERYKPDALPLEGGGEMRFREKLPRGKLFEPSAVEVLDRQGRLVRGWASEGESLRCDGMKFSSADQFFLIRKGPGRYLLAGGQIAVSGCTAPAEVWLVDPVSGRRTDDRPAWRLDRNTLTIQLDGRQRLGWVEVDVGSRGASARSAGASF